jgi:hypothetical protein
MDSFSPVTILLLIKDLTFSLLTSSNQKKRNNFTGLPIMDDKNKD